MIIMMTLCHENSPYYYHPDDQYFTDLNSIRFEELAQSVEWLGSSVRKKVNQVLEHVASSVAKNHAFRVRPTWVQTFYDAKTVHY